MLTQTQTQMRIRQLITQDNNTDNQSNQYYNQCMQFIASHLYTFYQEYAVKNNLSIQQTKTNVNQWDLNQWKSAINSLDISKWPKEAKQRLAALGAAAGVDTTHMMANIAKLGLLQYSVQQHTMIDNRVTGDANSQIQLMRKQMNLTPKQVDKVQTIVNDKSRQEIWSPNLWTDTDKLGNDVENLVNQHLRHGMSLQDMHSMLEVHANPKQFKPNQSIADRVHQMEFNARRIVRTESANMINEVNLGTYRQVGVTLLNVVTQDGVCDDCQEVADDGPYTIDSPPDIPVHPNCRCTTIPAGTDNERYITMNNSAF